MKIRSLLAACLAVLTALPITASADEGVTFVAPYSFGPYGAITAGFSFTPVTSITVTALGYFDPAQTFVGDHFVGLWDSTGTLLATADVTSADMTVGLEKYHALPSTVVLAAGSSYRVAGAGNLMGWDYLPVTHSSSISKVQGAFLYGAGLNYPAMDETDGAVFGGGDFLATSVPEPCTLLAFGIAGFGLLARRRIHKS